MSISYSYYHSPYKMKPLKSEDILLSCLYDGSMASRRLELSRLYIRCHATPHQFLPPFLPSLLAAKLSSLEVIQGSYRYPLGSPGLKLSGNP